MPASPYVIAGSLPFATGGGAMFEGMDPSNPQGSLRALGEHYRGAYNAALGLNQANYNNILRGYQQTLQRQQAGTQSVLGGWRGLENRVLGTISGVGQAERQDIRDQYAAQMGAERQRLTTAGLGNSTITSAVNRGLTLDEQKANITLADKLAQLTAGYQSQLGQGRLGFRERALQNLANQSNRQLDWMNSIEAPYPDAGAYGSLGQMLGQAYQSQQDRNMLAGAMFQASGGGAPGGMSTLNAGGGPSPYVQGNASMYGGQLGLQALGQAFGGRNQPQGQGQQGERFGLGATGGAYGGGGGGGGGGADNMSGNAFGFMGGWGLGGGMGSSGPGAYSSGSGMGLGTSYGQSGGYGGSPFSFGGGYNLSGMSGGAGGLGGYTSGYGTGQNAYNIPIGGVMGGW